MLCSKQSYNASNNNCFSSCPSSIDKCLKVPRGSVQRCCSVSPLSARAVSDNLFQTFHTTFFRGQGRLQRSPAFLKSFYYLNQHNLDRSILIWSHSKFQKARWIMSVISIVMVCLQWSFWDEPRWSAFWPCQRCLGKLQSFLYTKSLYKQSPHSYNVEYIHRKAINPLQELIWSTSAYLSWRGRAFTYQLGRSEVVLVSKTDDKPKISTDLYLCQAINCCGNQCRAAVFKSRWYRLLCRLCKLQWFITALPAMLNLYRHTRTHCNVALASTLTAS